MLIEYDGSGFYGFQKQEPSVRTVQAELERALTKFANQPINIITAGRTDSGVHALYQVINFITTVNRPLTNWLRGVNALLDLDIVINQVCYVPLEFSSRFNAISRTYQYYLYNHPVRPAILAKKVGWYYAKLDVNLMQEASRLLLGLHDFSSFRAVGCQAINPIRLVTNARVNQLSDKLICFEITANAFLYHMVRNVVGALIYIGNHKLTINGFKELLSDKNRLKAPPTFMADGLYLTKVEYKQAIFDYSPTNKFLI